MKAINFNDLQEKVCVITGGAGILGSSIVSALAKVGARIAILDLDAERAVSLAHKLNDDHGPVCMGVEANVLDRESIIRAKEQINERLGRISILVNGAGGNSPKATTGIEQLNRDMEQSMQDSFFGLELEGFDQVYALNFTGTLIPTMVIAQDMVEDGKGAILNISSMNALKPLTKIPAYSAAKASVNNLTEWLAVHLAKTGVRVNAIAPGFFLTAQNRFLLIDEPSGELTARGAKIINNTPMGRFGEPDELQGTVLYLLSDVSRFVTGIIIPVDGGYSAYGGV